MIALLLALAAAAPAQQNLTVLELQTKLTGAEKSSVDRGYLAERVRKYVKELAPQVRLIDTQAVQELLASQGKSLADCEGECEVETGRKLGADLVVNGEVLRFGQSFKLALRLHDTHTSQRLATEQASGKDLDELDAAIRPAVAALLAPLGARPVQLAGVPSINAPKEFTAPPLVLDLDPDLMVAYDAALRSDKAGQRDPEGAQKAWAAVAKFKGKNPYKDTAQARQKEWTEFGKQQKAAQAAAAEAERKKSAQRQDDRQKLNKVLPLESFALEQKLTLIDQYVSSYFSSEGQRYERLETEKEIMKKLPPAQRLAFMQSRVTKDATVGPAFYEELPYTEQREQCEKWHEAGIDTVEVEVRPSVDVFGLRETHGAVYVDGKVAGAMPGLIKLSWCKPETIEVHTQHFNDMEETARWDDDDAPPIKPTVPTIRNTLGQSIEVPVPARWLMDSQTITELKSGMQFVRKTQEQTYTQNLCPPQFHVAREQKTPAVPETEWNPLRLLSASQLKIAMGLEGDEAQFWIFSNYWPISTCAWRASSPFCWSLGRAEPTDKHRPVCVRMANGK